MTQRQRFAGAVMAVVMTAVASVRAAQPPAEVAAMDDFGQRFWAMHWAKVATMFAKVGEEFYALPGYNRRYPSSAGRTVEQWTREHTDSRQVRIGGNLVKTVTDRPPREEAEAAVAALPDLKVGQYGYLESVKVESLLGPRTMLVSEVWYVDEAEIGREIRQAEERGEQLIREDQARVRREREREREYDRRTRDYDNRNNRGTRYRDNNRERFDTEPRIDRDDVDKAIEQRYKHRQALIDRQKKEGRVKLRLEGWLTAGAAPGTRWKGPDGRGLKVAIVGEAEVEGGTRSRYGSRDAALRAVDAESFETMLSEAEFVELLKGCDMTPAQFVELAKQRIESRSLDEAYVSIAKALVASKAKADEAKAEAQREAEREAERAAREAERTKRDPDEAEKPAADEGGSAEKDDKDVPWYKRDRKDDDKPKDDAKDKSDDGDEKDVPWYKRKDRGETKEGEKSDGGDSEKDVPWYKRKD